MKQLVTDIHKLMLLVLFCSVLLTGCQQGESQDNNPPSEEEQESAEVRPEVTFALADD